MEYIDLEKLDVAITYMQRIADGKNPVNNMPAEDDDVLNNPNVIRCMFFVKEILEEVKRNEGRIGSKEKKKQKQAFPIEALGKFEYKGDIHISGFADQINQMIDSDVYRKFSYGPVIRWLKANNFLVEVVGNDNKTKNRPTEKGVRLGIYTERRTNAYGRDYTVVLYNQGAQEFIVKNMEAILNGEVAREEE